MVRINIKDYWPWPTYFPPSPPRRRYRRRRATVVEPPPADNALWDQGPIAPIYTKLLTLPLAQPAGNYGGQSGIQRLTDSFNQSFGGGHGVRGESVPWDGVPMTNWRTSTLAQLRDFLFTPTSAGYAQLRGIGDVYAERQPFQDPLHPTVAEVEYWNYCVIRHLRNLLGEPTPPPQDLFYFCRFIQAQTTLEAIAESRGLGGAFQGPGWLDNYGTIAAVNCTDQIPYLDGKPCCFDYSGGYALWAGPPGNQSNYLFWGQLLQYCLRAFVEWRYIEPNGVDTFDQFVLSPTLGLAWEKRLDRQHTHVLVWTFD